MFWNSSRKRSPSQQFPSQKGFWLHISICDRFFMKLGTASTPFRMVECRLLIYWVRMVV